MLDAKEMKRCILAFESYDPSFGYSTYWYVAGPPSHCKVSCEFLSLLPYENKPLG